MMVAIAILPVIIVYLLLSKFIVRGDRRLRRKQGAALGAAVCRMRGPPKGRSRRRAPQEGAEAVIRKGKRVKLDVLRGLTEPLSHASRASSPEKESQEQEFSPQKTN